MSSPCPRGHMWRGERLGMVTGRHNTSPGASQRSHKQINILTNQLLNRHIHWPSSDVQSGGCGERKKKEERKTYTHTHTAPKLKLVHQLDSRTSHYRMLRQAAETARFKWYGPTSRTLARFWRQLTGADDPRRLNRRPAERGSASSALWRDEIFMLLLQLSATRYKCSWVLVM